MPHLRFNLAHGYLANGNWIEALRHIVPVCLVSDPILSIVCRSEEDEEDLSIDL